MLPSVIRRRHAANIRVSITDAPFLLSAVHYRRRKPNIVDAPDHLAP